MRDSNEPCQKSADKLNIPYGGGFLPVCIDADIIEPAKKFTALTEEEVSEKLFGDAVMSYPLRETIEDGENILIVLPDATRKSGAEQILHDIVRTVEEFGKNLSFIIATGTHRQPTEDELKTIITPEIYSKYKEKILTHDAEDYSSMDFYGITKRKTTVLLNRAYRENDTIITIGSVSYHYFAGYGGGRKLIFPGIAGQKAIEANHKLALNVATGKRHENAATGVLKNNPVHDDMVECLMIARSKHTFFAVNTLLDEDGRIADMVCGDLFMSHIQAAQRLDEYCLVNSDKRYDLLILSAGGSPKDINMVQSQKYLDRVLPLLKEGGTAVLFADCPDGYGNRYFEEFFDIKTSDGMHAELMRDYKINRQTAYNLKSNLEKYRVYLYSSFSKEETERMGFSKLSDVSEIEGLAKEAVSRAVVFHPADIFIK